VGKEQVRAVATVLVVEDDPDLRFLYAAALARSGHTVTTAPETAPALLQLTNRPIDVIVLDVGLPDLPGTRLLEFMRGDPRLRAIPVVVLSADESTRERALALGAACFITKPVRLKALATLVDRLLNGQHPGEQA
jgi:two-component system chemotaxis response regulator CheY